MIWFLAFMCVVNFVLLVVVIHALLTTGNAIRTNSILDKAKLEYEEIENLTKRAKKRFGDSVLANKRKA